MGIADRLAGALGRTDEAPNVELAMALADSGDSAAIAGLVRLLAAGSRPQQHDAIKVLYELGERRPALIAPHVEAFLALLAARDNRMVWGALSALAPLTATTPDVLMAQLAAILAAADRSSVIARDKAMAILAALNGEPRFAARVTPILLARLDEAADNQFPMYAELAAPTIGTADAAAFAAILRRRRATIPQPAKQQRIDAVLRRLERRQQRSG